jgi:hypothetical protein
MRNQIRIMPLFPHQRLILRVQHGVRLQDAKLRSEQLLILHIQLRFNLL